MATYNVDITFRSRRTFGKIEDCLIAMHREYDPAVDPDHIKVIGNYLASSEG